MTPYYSDDWLSVYQGDCREVMAQMPAESVHTVVTSPPYWGLRDYGTATWIGGDDGCDHRQSAGGIRNKGRDRAASGGTFHDSPRIEDALGLPFREVCRKCGAVRQDSQLGLEPTPEEYVANMVAVFREVRRVLRADGTCWVNLGDSYNGGGAAGSVAAFAGKQGTHSGGMRIGPPNLAAGLKPKDLVGIPWRVAFALQADGWYLRSDIIWAKPNPMPESVTDRPTKAHEYLFLLSKSPRYYYDADAVREDAIHAGRIVRASDPETAKNGQKGQYGATALGFTQHDTVVGSGRNLRTVWSIATQPYPGAHFATFPEKLVEPCVKAGTSERGVCPECGAPWRRATDVVYVKSPVHGSGSVVGRHEESGANGWDGSGMPRLNKEVTTTGWQPPDCGHYDSYTGLHAQPVPAVVLDPFAGSGTTGRVAQRLGRRAVLMDLSGDYLVQAMKRNTEIPLGLEAV